MSDSADLEVRKTARTVIMTALDQSSFVAPLPDDQVRQGQFMELERLHNGVSREIHEGLGFEKDEATVLVRPFSGQPRECLAAYGEVFVLCQSIQKKETRIVAGPLVRGAGIAQPRYDIRFHWVLEARIRLQPLLLLPWPCREH